MIRQRHLECVLAAHAIAAGLDQAGYERLSDEFATTVGVGWADAMTRGSIEMVGRFLAARLGASVDPLRYFWRNRRDVVTGDITDPVVVIDFLGTHDFVLNSHAIVVWPDGRVTCPMLGEFETLMSYVDNQIRSHMMITAVELNGVRVWTTTKEETWTKTRKAQAHQRNGD